VKKLQALAGRILVAAVVATAFSGGLPEGPMSARASEPTLQERGDALMKNVEDMIAHGGMGDAKAIVHHCAAASGDAEAILKQLPESDPRRSQAGVPLHEIIQHCQRVSALGIHADPGQLLNPAIKARAAARASLKGLGLVKTN
jgi:hypothetical protein